MGQGLPRSSRCLRPGGRRGSCPGAGAEGTAKWRRVFENVAAVVGETWLDPPRSPSSWNKLGLKKEIGFEDDGFHGHSEGLSMKKTQT